MRPQTLEYSVTPISFSSSLYNANLRNRRFTKCGLYPYTVSGITENNDTSAHVAHTRETRKTYSILNVKHHAMTSKSSSIICIKQ